MKNKVIFFLSLVVIVLVFIHFNREETVKTVVETVTKYDTITKTIDNTQPTEVKKVFIKVPIETIINDTITKVVYKDKEVNEYKYKDSLKNGVLTSTIWADKIYKRDIELKTFNKEEITTITNTVFKSQLYVGGGIVSDFDKRISSVSLNGYYTHKNRMLIGVGINYNFDIQKPMVNLQFAVRF